MLIATTCGSAIAETCAPQFNKKLSRATIVEGGYLVLRRLPGDTQPFLIQEDCVVIGADFWPKGQRTRFLYLGVVNFVPSIDEPDVSFLGVQAVRANPTEDGSDFIRAFRRSGWVRQVEGNIETLRAVSGRRVDLTIDAWRKIHANSFGEIKEADSQMRLKWHAQPAEDVPSSWEFKGSWQPVAIYPNGTLITNLLLRFSLNRDENKVSVIPFEVGLPHDAREIIITVHSNVDAIKRSVKFKFQ